METVERSHPQSPAALALLKELNATLYDITGDDGSSSFADSHFDSQTDVFLIIRLHQAPAACGCFRRLDASTCELKRMYAKKKGLGTKILLLLEEEAIKLGYTTVVLSTRKINTHAINFYLRNGYSKIESYGKYKYTNLSICLGKLLQT
ncbi:GNAT family N-acetyltransferase [Halioxenophilus aromaticivorans]